MTINENDLRADSRVERLLKNRKWRDAAEAAIAYLFRGVSCPIAFLAEVIYVGTGADGL